MIEIESRAVDTESWEHKRKEKDGERLVSWIGAQSSIVLLKGGYRE